MATLYIYNVQIFLQGMTIVGEVMLGWYYTGGL